MDDLDQARKAAFDTTRGAIQEIDNILKEIKTIENNEALLCKQICSLFTEEKLPKKEGEKKLALLLCRRGEALYRNSYFLDGRITDLRKELEKSLGRLADDQRSWIRADERVRSIDKIIEQEILALRSLKEAREVLRTFIATQIELERLMHIAEVLSILTELRPSQKKQEKSLLEVPFKKVVNSLLISKRTEEILSVFQTATNEVVAAEITLAISAETHIKDSLASLKLKEEEVITIVEKLITLVKERAASTQESLQTLLRVAEIGEFWEIEGKIRKIIDLLNSNAILLNVPRREYSKIFAVIREMEKSSVEIEIAVKKIMDLFPLTKGPVEC